MRIWYDTSPADNVAPRLVPKNIAALDIRLSVEQMTRLNSAGNPEGGGWIKSE